MDILNNCFRDIIFTKVDEKNDFGIYGAGIATGLGGGYKSYVLVFVPSEFATQKQSHIHNLQWQNLQTRNLAYSYRLKSQPWVLPDDVPDIMLYVSSRTKEHSVYTSPGFPFEILLLHDSKKKTIYQYNNKIMLSSALNTFNSVFNYLGESINFEPEIPQTTPFVGNWFQNEVDDSFELV